MSWKQIFILCIIIGIGLLGLGYFFQKKAEAIDKWPGVTGKVIAAKVVQSTSQKSLRKNDKSSQSVLTFYPVIEYEYTVNDKKYSSDRLSLSVEPKSNPKYFEPILKKYAPGTDVKVFYNPDNPADAVLEKVKWIHYILYVLGAIWMAVWILAFLIYTIVNFFR